MALVDESGGWWRAQCPARSTGFSHVHSIDCCDPAHSDPTRCCECGHGPYERPAATAPPPISVADRLRDLGLRDLGPGELSSCDTVLTDDEIARLTVNVLHILRKRGYR